MYNDNADDFLSNLNTMNPMANYSGNFQQIDLNDEKNLMDLEDPTLIEHMAQARKHWLEMEIQNKATAEEIEIIMNNASKLLSSMTIILKSTFSTISTTSENLILQNSNILKISSNETPHGYPKIQTNKDLPIAIIHLNKKISPISTNLIEVVEIISNFEKDLILLGRNYKLLVGKLSTFNEKLIHENKELINEKLIHENKEVINEIIPTDEV